MSRKPNRCRHTVENRSLPFEKLEDRRVLAASVYVDFGNAFEAAGGLTISDTQSESLNGPSVFGDAFELSSLSQDYISYAPNTTNGEIDGFYLLVMIELEELFRPFDITVQQAQSSNVGEVQATLASTSTNDAYIYVGGTTPGLVTQDSGAAVIDIGNQTDNLGFVFTAGFRFDGLSNKIRSIAADIARQSGFTFGLQSTEASIDKSHGNVMSIFGTDTSGELINEFRQVFNGWGFVRSDLDRTLDLGVSAGQENSFELLVDNVGARNDGVAYSTTLGDATPTVLNFVDDNTVNIQVGDYSANGIDISGGLQVKAINQFINSTIQASNRVFDVSVSRDHIRLASNVQIYVDHQVRVGIELGDMNDEINIGDDTRLDYLNAGGGDDTITISAAIHRQPVFGGEGNDRFIVPGWDANGVNFSTRDNFDGGPGHDILDYSAITTPTTTNIWDVTEEGFTFGLEFFITKVVPSRLVITDLTNCLAPLEGCWK